MTLIEVLIAVFILVIISFSIYQATTDSFRVRSILSEDGDFFNAIRLAMNILEKDIAMIYSPTMILPSEPTPTPSPPDSEDLSAIMGGDSNLNSDYWTSVINKTGIRPSHFIGKETELSFIATSHIRIYKKSPESIFSKIAYKLENPSDQTEFPGTKALFKTENTDAFNLEDDNEKLTHNYPLLYGIKKLKFRYYRKEKDQWNNSWDSETADLKNLYPDLIEVELEIIGHNRLQFNGTFKFRPEMPLYGLKPTL